VDRQRRHLDQEGLYVARLRYRHKDLAKHSQSGGQFFGIHASNNGKIMIFAGGFRSSAMARWWRDRCERRLGDQDHAVAEAGAAAF